MKPRVAFFDFASCEGCQLQVANLEEQLLSLLETVDVVSFREVMAESSDDYDIAFVEGSITRPIDEVRLKKIRLRAKVLVALGSCACFGGVNALKNQFTTEDVVNEVYGDLDPSKNPLFDTFPTKAVDEVVEVDHRIPGCPIDRKELGAAVTAFALGKKPETANYPVCVECKLKENGCLFERNQICLGPITRAGCEAACPSYGSPCLGCRGTLPNANRNGALDVLERFGHTPGSLISKYKIFCFNQGVREWVRT